MKSIMRNREYWVRPALFTALFALGVILGRLAWDWVTLPYRNPWGIVSLLSRVRYNPLTNIARFLVFLAIPPGIVAGFYTLLPRHRRSFWFRPGPGPADPDLANLPARPLPAGLPGEPEKQPEDIRSGLFRRCLPAAGLVLLAVVMAIGTPTYKAWRQFDHFHEGEALGTAVSWEKGRLPYRDFLFAHGVYQDPLRAVAAFRLFGRSIGAVRTLESAVKVLFFVALALFLLSLYRRRTEYAYAVLVMLAAIGYASYEFRGPPLLFVPRDLVTVAFLLAFLPLAGYARTGGKKRNIALAGFFFAFIPVAAFGYSIDRGFYLLAAGLFLWPCLWVVSGRSSPARGDRQGGGNETAPATRNNGFRRAFGGGSLLGAAAGAGVLGVLVRGQFGEFFRFTFWVVPRFKELFDGFVFPIADPRLLAACALLAANACWLAVRFLGVLNGHGNAWKAAIPEFLRRYLPETGLGLLAFFFFRSALGRADWEHAAYSLLPAYLLSLHIVLIHYLEPCLERFRAGRWCRRLVVVAAAGMLLAGAFRIAARGLLAENFPAGRPDAAFLSPGDARAVTFLRERLGPGEDFLALTSEASWYYLLDKPSPTRFPVIWFAAPPFYQREAIAALERANVTLVLYDNDHFASRLDGIPNEDRLPVLMGYIRRNYTFLARVGGNEIWSRKTY